MKMVVYSRQKMEKQQQGIQFVFRFFFFFFFFAFESWLVSDVLNYSLV